MSIVLCPLCGDCGHAGEVVAINRFRPEGASGYRVIRTGEVLPTRAAALEAACAARRRAHTERGEQA